ncbi:hypothetical protein, partial [Klebsiella michiganensis]|uniref:hypothetical protein n=3 Tax=Klebsiella michiganensis TaxID=1134687 RepID=UPI001C49C6A8
MSSPLFSRLALRLAGLRVYRRLRDGSPDKARQAPPPGSSAQCHLRFFPRLALRLAGLRVQRCLRAGSPDKARQAPPPGSSAQCHLRFSPGSRCAWPGYGFTVVC